MNLIFVHGRSQENKDPIKLQEEWIDALDLGIHAAKINKYVNVNIGFPYYGDVLNKLVQDFDAPLIQEAVTKGIGNNDSYQAFRGEVIQELANNAGVKTSEIDAQYEGEVIEKGPLNWEWVQAILKVLDKTAVGDFSIDKFTRDVYLYINVAKIRSSIDSIVSKAISNEPCVVVAHSLGTVVAYNVLRQHEIARDVRLFLTLGSPLGVNAINRSLSPPALRMPEDVKEWKNAFDTRDVVALRPLDSTTFPISPAIYNKSDVSNKTENRHGIAGYLDNKEIASWICAALT